MAKKKVLKKFKKLTPQTTIKAEACSGCEILIGLLVIAAAVLGILYACSAGLSKENTIKVGDCFIDRSYQPVIVAYTYKSLGEAILRPAEINVSNQYGGWYLTTNYSKDSRERTFDFVKENYTKVSCFNRD